jgi:transposase-like protein
VDTFAVKPILQKDDRYDPESALCKSCNPTQADRRKRSALQIRRIRYLNNIVEHDHRAIEQQVRTNKTSEHSLRVANIPSDHDLTGKRQVGSATFKMSRNL